MYAKNKVILNQQICCNVCNKINPNSGWGRVKLLPCSLFLNNSKKRIAIILKYLAFQEILVWHGATKVCVAYSTRICYHLITLNKITGIQVQIYSIYCQCNIWIKQQNKSSCYTKTEIRFWQNMTQRKQGIFYNHV